MEANRRVHGTFAAAVTPLTAEDGSIDRDGIAAVVDFYARAGLDGILALGTTGEGIMFSVDERRLAADEFVTWAHQRLAVVVHCGAQTTRDTVVLAEHAASHGAAGVAVIPPPYFALDAEAIWRHLDAAARSCAPLPFYIYEFAARSGYAVPVEVVRRLQSTASNLAGLKVSDSPFDRVEPYLIPGLDVFIGAEGLIWQGMASGAAGAVSGLAAALPELTIEAVRSGTPEASAVAARARSAIEPFPFQAALKFILQRRGVAVAEAVRPPLSGLNAEQREALSMVIEDPAGALGVLHVAA